MKFGQSIAMLVFTSLAILGSNKTYEELKQRDDISATSIGLMIVAIVAVVFCILGAVILFFYNEKKVMKTIAKPEDAALLAVVEGETEEEAKEEIKTETEEKEVEKGE